MSELRLTREERSALLAGGPVVILRDHKPDAEPGLIVPLVRRKAHSVPRYDRFDPLKIVGTIEVPEFISAWIEVKGVIRHRRGGWKVNFELHDERHPSRNLAPTAGHGPPTEPGLRTRKPERPRPKGEGVGSFTPETARGYGAGGNQAIDTGAVDDDELARQRAKADERWACHGEQHAADERAARQQRAIRQMLKEGVRELGAEAGQLWLAKIQRAAERAREEIKGEEAA